MVDLEDVKIEINSEQESIAFQEECFKQGFKWNGINTITKNTKERYLYTDSNDNFITYGTNDANFLNSDKKEIYFKDLNLTTNLNNYSIF